MQGRSVSGPALRHTAGAHPGPGDRMTVTVRVPRYLPWPVFRRFLERIEASGRIVRSARNSRFQATSSTPSGDTSSSELIRGIGDGNSHRQPSNPPTVAISSVGRRPIAVASRPPATAPSGRTP